MGTFTPKGLSFILVICTTKNYFLQQNRLIFLAFQGFPLGGSGGPEKDRMFCFCGGLRSLSSDSSGQLDIFRHDGHTFGVDGTEVGIFKQSHQVCFGSLL